MREWTYNFITFFSIRTAKEAKYYDQPIASSRIYVYGSF